MSGPGGGPKAKLLHRQVAREGYERRVGSLSQADLAVAAGQERRLRAMGVQADLVGIAPETAVDLVDEWERLARAYPDAVELWLSLAPDVELLGLGSADLMGYTDGRMLWNPLTMAVPRPLLDRVLKQAADDGSHPPGCGSVRALAAHEFAHIVEDVVRARLAECEWQALLARLVECRISGYTEAEPGEAFAVCFCAMLHGPRLAHRQRRAVRLLRHMLRGLGMSDACS